MAAPFQWSLAALETLMAEDQMDRHAAVLRPFSVVELWRVRRVCRAFHQKSYASITQFLVKNRPPPGSRSATPLRCVSPPLSRRHRPFRHLLRLAAAASPLPSASSQSNPIHPPPRPTACAATYLARSSGRVLHGNRLHSRPPRHLARRLLATPHPLRE